MTICANFKSDLVAMTFGDGTTAILGYNPNCMVTDIYNSNANVTKCLVMIYDTNSKKAPNIMSFDMASMNLSTDEDSEIEIGEIFQPRSYTIEECYAAANAGAPIKGCPIDNDYWAYAVDKCYKEGSHLPTANEMKKIAQQLYGEVVNYTGETTGLTIVDQALWEKLGGSDAGFWASLEKSAGNAYYRYFSSSSTYYYHTSWRHISNVKAFCIAN